MDGGDAPWRRPDQSIWSESSARAVLQLMVDHRMKSLPVLDAEQRLAGIIAREDIMRALTESARG